MNVHPSRHDDHAASVESRCTLRHIGNHAPVLDADVSYFTVHAIRRVIQSSAGYSKPPDAGHTDPALSRMAPCSASSTSTVERVAVSGGRSESGTSSIRYPVPPSWIPATPVSMATAGDS